MPTTDVQVRKDPKQSWARADAVPLLDSRKRLEALVEGLNRTAGFVKFRVRPA